MAKPKKTEKPEKPQAEKDTKAEEVIEAQVIEETAPLTEQAEEPAKQDEPVVELEEPGTEAPQSDDEPDQAETDPVVAEGEPAEDLSTKDETEELAATEHNAEPHPAPVPEKSGSKMPAFFAGVLAAGVGFGAAGYLATEGILFSGKSDEAIAELRRQIDEQDDAVRLLRSNQDKIGETANAAREGLSGVADANARVAALSERLEDLGGKVQALEGRILEIEKRPMTEGASSAAIEAYEREVEQLRAMVSEQLAEAETLKENSAKTARETLAQASLTRVISAVDTGVPFRGALMELASVSGVSIPAELSEHADTGVPTPLMLVDAFPEYARAALADARKLESSGDGNRLSAFLKSQLGARSTEPKEGTDADAVLSRAEAALREGRLEASLAELSALPESSQALMADWQAQAQTRLSALAAIETLAQSLNSN